VRPSETKRGQERLTKKLAQTCRFRFPISPNMRIPDLAGSDPTNNLPWAAPKRSQPAAYGRLGQARAGYGRRKNIFLDDAPITFSSWSLEFGFLGFRASRFAAPKQSSGAFTFRVFPHPSASFHLFFPHSSVIVVARTGSKPLGPVRKSVRTTNRALRIKNLQLSAAICGYLHKKFPAARDWAISNSRQELILPISNRTDH